MPIQCGYWGRNRETSSSAKLLDKIAEQILVVSMAEHNGNYSASF
jgi:hypothetical protein